LGDLPQAKFKLRAFPTRQAGKIDCTLQKDREEHCLPLHLSYWFAKGQADAFERMENIL